MKKEQWIDLFVKIEIDKEGMKKWHREFEKAYPEDHQEFLEWLNVDKSDINSIREQSRG